MHQAKQASQQKVVHHQQQVVLGNGRFSGANVVLLLLVGLEARSQGNPTQKPSLSLFYRAFK